MKNVSKDLTVGKPWKSIFLFALPLLGSALIQQLYSTVDLIFVSRFIGTEAASAVGSSDLLVTCLVGLFTGISVGSNVVAAQAFGAKKDRELHKLIQTVVTFGIVGACVILILGELLSPTFLKLLNTPESIRPLALVYLRIYFLCIFSIVLYNLCSGIVRALGDSGAALRFQIIGGIANVFADFFMIVVLKWGIAGAAFATFLSQTAAAAMTIRYLLKLPKNIRLRLDEPQISGNVLKKVLEVGIPSGVQSMIMTFSNLIVQSVINGFGVITIAAFVVYFKAELFIWYPLVSVGQALVTFTAQNVGARKMDRVKSGIITGILMGIAIAVGISSLMLLFGRQIFGIFNTDPEVIQTGLTIAHITFPLYFLYPLFDGFGSVLKGFGKGISPMVISVGSTCVLRLALLMFFSARWHTVAAIAWVYPISWGAAGLGMFLMYLNMTRGRVN